MELEDRQTLKLVQERIQAKVYAFREWDPFITWLKGMTTAKFKTFIVGCINEVTEKGDTEKADLLEVKTLIEGT